MVGADTQPIQIKPTAQLNGTKDKGYPKPPNKPGKSPYKKKKMAKYLNDYGLYKCMKCEIVGKKWSANTKRRIGEHVNSHKKRRCPHCDLEVINKMSNLKRHANTSTIRCPAVVKNPSDWDLVEN